MQLRKLIAIGVVIALASVIVPASLGAGWNSRHTGTRAQSVYTQQMEKAISESYQITIQEQSPSISATHQAALYALFQTLVSQVCNDAKIIPGPLPAGGTLFVGAYC